MNSDRITLANLTPNLVESEIIELADKNLHENQFSKM